MEIWIIEVLLFKIQNSVRITEGSDNGDSDNRGSTVYIYSRTLII